jgi:H2-forming N5,N10-methylenetetrahydromethanopterin dehydrogenase-like enzyme
MEQVATQMAEGDEEAAEFLHDLAAQLEEGFVEAAKVMDANGDTSTEVYLNLIEELLNCSDGEAVAQLLNANLELIDGGLLQTMAQVATILEERGEDQAAALLFSMASKIAEAI